MSFPRYALFSYTSGFVWTLLYFIVGYFSETIWRLLEPLSIDLAGTCLLLVCFFYVLDGQLTIS